MAKDVDGYIRAAGAWAGEMTALRAVLLDAGLDEAIKWNKPCYSADGANVAIMQPMKDVLGLMFFKGALLHDPTGALHEQGPNSRSAKRLEFTSVSQVRAAAPVVTALVAEARDAQAEGRSPGPAPEQAVPAELARRLEDDDALHVAFEGLTPGRRREYHLHIGAAKKAETREARVEKCVPRILAGRGLRDR